MYRDRYSTRYSDLNRALRTRIRNSATCSVSDFSAVCRLMEAVEAPSGPVAIRSLKDSRLCETIAQFVLQLSEDGAPREAAIGVTRDRLRLLWRAVSRLSTGLDERSLAIFARGAGFAKDSALLFEISTILFNRRTLSSRTVQTLASATRRTGVPETLEMAIQWIVAHRPVLEAPTIGALASACGQVQRPDLLERVWELRQSSVDDLGAFASAWVDVDLPHRFKDVWRAFQTDCRLDPARRLTDPRAVEARTRMWGAFAAAASRTDAVPIEEMWALARPFAATFEDRTLCTFADAAGRATIPSIRLAKTPRRPRVRVSDDPLIAIISEVWSLLADRRALSPRSLQTLANAVRFSGAVGTLEMLVQWTVSHRTALDEPAIGALASACGQLHRPDLLERVWESRRSGLDDLGAFASAWVELDLPNRFKDVWRAFQTEYHHNPLREPADPVAVETRSRIWGAFAAAASRTDAVPIEEVWALARPFAATLADKTLSAFADAAGRANCSESLSEIADALLVRPTDQRSITILFNAAAETRDSLLVERLCRLCIQRPSLESR